MCNLQISDIWIFNFWIFKSSDIDSLWSKITIFIIEISLKLHLHTKYGWNNPNSLRLGLESPKFHFLAFLAAQKFIAHTNIHIHVTGSIFSVNWFFLNAPNNVLYQNQYQLKLLKKTYLPPYGALNLYVFWTVPHKNISLLIQRQIQWIC